LSTYLTKLKTQKKRVRLEKRYTKTYKRNLIKKDGDFVVNDYSVNQMIFAIKNFDFKKRTQEWNPDFPHELDTRLTPRIYVNKTIQSFCEYLKDLFCVTDKILLDIRYLKSNNTGICYYKISKDGYRKIKIGARTGVRAVTLIHEFLHAAGFGHEYDIDGYTDYRSNCALDNYSKLVCKDIFGKREVFIN